MGLVEFGTLQVDSQFRNLLSGKSLNGGNIWGIEPPNDFYTKIASVKIRGRVVNARRLSDGTYCWIAPSHLVEPVKNK